MSSPHPVLDEIQHELVRLNTHAVSVAWDEHFEPAAGPLVKVELEDAHWHLLPEDFRALLRDLEDGAGDAQVRRAIEQRGTFVWHGPSPPGSRDTSS